MKIKNVMQVALSLSLGCVGTGAFAHEDHDHDHEQGHEEDEHDHDHEEGEFDFDKYQLVLEGTQAFGDECFLGVVSVENAADGSFQSAIVETSFSHGDEGPGSLTVAKDPTTPNALSFKEVDAKGNVIRAIAILLDAGATEFSIENALKYAVSWKHLDHTDTGVCDNLQVVYEADHDDHDHEDHDDHDHEDHHDHDHEQIQAQ